MRRKYGALFWRREATMVCRNDPEDPRKCEQCGQFLWVSDDGLFCGDCGVTMPCTMRLLPPPAV